MNLKSSKKILCTWIGYTDIKSMKTTNSSNELGPVAQALKHHEYDEVNLISNYEEKEINQYLAWLKPQTKNKIQSHYAILTSPINFGEIYTAVNHIINIIKQNHGEDIKLVFHLSPGTSAMAAVWILLAKTRYAAELIESSIKYGVNTAYVPFDISAEFIPNLIKQVDKQVTELNSDVYPVDDAFKSIIHQSNVMKKIILKAQQIAPRTLSVLIEGESGTGKELLARSIHKASLRHKQPFIAVNCGAINKELAESEFFGHQKGAFTGANTDRKGYFETANNGTLFLDEIGELPLTLQVKLLRALQEQEIISVGSSKPIKIDIRVIAATNRNLILEVEKGSFREDLFYRIAVAVIRLPALREREGDINLLINHLLQKINEECKSEPNWKHKKLSISARNIMFKHRWRGNFRELSNTLIRATLWSSKEIIEIEDIQEAILESPNISKKEEGILNQDLSSNINLPEIIEQVKMHYLKRALQKTQNNKTKAAKLLGIKNYQTIDNWLK